MAGNRTLNTKCAEAAGTGTRCTWPPKGQTVSAATVKATVPWGQCTWGALQQWYARAGYYPRTSGNAGAWDTTMPQYGWRVSSVPTLRAFVIFDPYKQGSLSDGHVGYVTGIKHVGAASSTSPMSR